MGRVRAALDCTLPGLILGRPVQAVLKVLASTYAAAAFRIPSAKVGATDRPFFPANAVAYPPNTGAAMIAGVLAYHRNLTKLFASQVNFLSHGLASGVGSALAESQWV